METSNSFFHIEHVAERDGGRGGEQVKRSHCLTSAGPLGQIGARRQLMTVPMASTMHARDASRAASGGSIPARFVSASSRSGIDRCRPTGR